MPTQPLPFDPKQLGNPNLGAAGALPLAGEANGHIFFADRWYGFSDALYAAARLLEVLSLQAGNSAEAFAPYTDTY